MKTLRLHLPVLDSGEMSEFLDIVTAVEGVVAALVDAATATLDVVVRTDASSLLVREQVTQALAGSSAAVPS